MTAYSQSALVRIIEARDGAERASDAGNEDEAERQTELAYDIVIAAVAMIPDNAGSAVQCLKLARYLTQQGNLDQPLADAAFGLVDEALNTVERDGVTLRAIRQVRTALQVLPDDGARWPSSSGVDHELIACLSSILKGIAGPHLVARPTGTDSGFEGRRG
jgi:hypothetical protein